MHLAFDERSLAWRTNQVITKSICHLIIRAWPYGLVIRKNPCPIESYVVLLCRLPCSECRMGTPLNLGFTQST